MAKMALKIDVLVLSYSKNNYLDKEKCNGTLFLKCRLKVKMSLLQLLDAGGSQKTTK